MSRKLLSWILILSMIFSLCSVPAFAEAENGEDEQIEDVLDEDPGIPSDNEEETASSADDQASDDGDLTEDDQIPDDQSNEELSASPDDPAAEAEPLPGSAESDQLDLTDPSTEGGEEFISEDDEVLFSENNGITPDEADSDLPEEADRSISVDEAADDDADEPDEILYGEVCVTVPGTDSGGQDSDALLSGYFDLLVRGGNGGNRGSAAGDLLAGSEAILYSFLAEKIDLVAKGQLSSTEFSILASSLNLTRSSWSISELGLEDDPIFDSEGYLTDASKRALNAALGEVLSTSSVNSALLADYPFELFWYDKTSGYSFNYYIIYDGESLGINPDGDFTVRFYVADEYAVESFSTNTELIQSVQNAASNARSIVSAYSSNSDRAKLMGYLTEICSRVSYNDDALEPNVSYGNPWQLIWVFDGDTETNVVCEGYSKAFQYLCDLSSFESNLVRCLSVSGSMGGPHMWNVVRLADGINYLVDVTNCDSGMIGEPDKLFLAVPTSGDLDDGYTFTANGYQIGYTYDAETLATFSREDLVIGETGQRQIIDSGSCGAEGGNLTWTLYDDGELVIEGTGDMADYWADDLPWKDYLEAISSVIICSGVTSIGNSAFSECANISHITIPEGVTVIGYNAFSGCAQLREITLPDSLVTIENEAFFHVPISSITFPIGLRDLPRILFWDTSALQEILVAEDNQYYCSVDGVVFSKDMKELVLFPIGRTGHYTVPEGVESLREGSFGGSRLSSVTLPESLRSIGEEAFWCAWITGNIRIPANVSEICRDAFGNCAISSYTVASGNASFKSLDGVLYSLDGTTLYNYPRNKAGDSYVIQSGVTTIAPSAFAGSNLRSITIPYSVTNIGNSAFAWNTSLENLTLPYGLQRIERLFYYCSGLQSVTIPVSVTKIDAGSFEFCDSLTDVYYGGTEEQWNAVSIGSSNAALTGAEMHYGDGQRPSIAAGECGAQGDNLTWTLYNTGELIIEGSGAMADYSTNSLVPWYDYTNLITSIDISNDATSIGDFAFCNLSNLPTVSIPDSVTGIGKHAFSGCTSLSNVNIPSGVAAIRDHTFAHCSSMTSITIPASVNAIGEGAFSYSSRLAEVAGMTGVTTIDASAFYACSALEIITLPTGLTDIGEFAFAYCNELKSVEIPEGVATMGESVFYECTALESVVLPSSLTSIVYHTFFDCTNLTSVTISEGITNIERYSFYGCTALNSITLPDGVSSIGESAFSDSGLSCITIPNTITNISKNAFRYTSLGNVYFIGTETQRDALKSGWIEEGNSRFINATWHYNPIGTCGANGDNLTWILYDSGELVISGSGDMADYDWDNERWAGSQDMIRSVSFPSGITSIGDLAFQGCDQLISVIIPDGVTRIGAYAFSNCSSLTEIFLPEDLATIGFDAFEGCTSLRDIYYSGTLAQRDAHFNDGSWSADSTIRSSVVWHCSDAKVDMTFAELKALLASQDYSEGWTTVYLNGSGQFIVEEDLILPDGMDLTFNGIELVIPEGVTLTVNGSIYGTAMTVNGSVYMAYNRIGQGDFVDHVTVNGSMTLNMWLWVHNITGRDKILYEDNGRIAYQIYPQNEDELHDAIASAMQAQEHTSYSINVGTPIVLTRDLVIPTTGFHEKIREIDFFADLTIPEGITLVNNGDLYFNNCPVIHGTFENHGYIRYRSYAYNEQDLRERLSEELNIVGDGFVNHTVNLSEDITLQSDLVIDNNKQLYVYGDHCFVIPEGIRLTVNGQLRQAEGEIRLDGTLLIQGTVGLYGEVGPSVLRIGENGVLGGTGRLIISYETPEEALIGYCGPEPIKADETNDYWVVYFSDGWAYSNGGQYYYHNGEFVRGWFQIDGKWYYFDSEGLMQTGLLNIDGNTYFFDNYGRMTTGWVKVDGVWYYFLDNGAACVGWKQVGGKWYYFGGDGAMATGLQQIGGKTYFFNDNGLMFTGWKEIDGVWYYFLNNGAACVGWKQVGSKWYYFGEDGAMYTGLQTIGGKLYYFESSGAMATGWKQIDGNWYFFLANGSASTGLKDINGKQYCFNAEGVMQTGFQQIDGRTYFFNDNGSMFTGWKEIGGVWYYFLDNGAAATGWKQVGSKWYYFGEDGAMYTGLQTIGAKKYYFLDNGSMVTGWKQIDGTWYYFLDNGAACIGWKKLGSSWYYFDSDGSMLANTSRTIGSKVYYFAENGVCTNP